MVVGRPAVYASLMLLLSLLALPGQAQVPVGHLYFTSESLAVSDFADCRDSDTFAASPDLPAAGEVPVGVSYGALGCRLHFQYTATQDFEITGPLQVDLFLGCDAAPASPAGNDLRFHFFKNGKEVKQKALETGNCVGELEVHDALDVSGTTFAAGDVLLLDIVFWYVSPDKDAAQTLWVEVGGETASGISAPGLNVPVVADAVAEAQRFLEDLTAPTFLHEFENATSDDYVLNFTVPWHNATLRQTAEVASGSANVTVLRDGEVFLSVLLTNQTAPAPPATGNGTSGNATADGNTTDAQADDLPVLADAAGNWSIVIDYEGFVGRLGMELAEHVPTPDAATNATEEPVLTADATTEDAPGPALPLLALGLVALAVVRRRRS